MAESRIAALLLSLGQRIAAFFGARGREVYGLSLMALAIALVLAMASYTDTDPSLNRASSHDVQNWLGVYGAIAADIIVQYIGIGAFLVLPALLMYGWRRFRNQTLGLPYLRFGAALAGVILGSAAISLYSALYPIASDAQALLAGWSRGGLLGIMLIERTGFLFFIPQVTVYVKEAQTILFVVAALGGLALELFAAGWLRKSLHAIFRVLVFIVTLPSKQPRAKLAEIISKPFGVIRYLSSPLSGLSKRFSREAKSEEGAARPQRNNLQDESADKSATRLRQKATVVSSANLDSARAAENARNDGGIPVETPLKKPRLGTRAAREDQHDLPLGRQAAFELPPLRLLSEPRQIGGKKVSEDALEANARLLESVLEDFGVRGKILRVRPGPVVTLYELEPAAGIRASRVVGLSDDIARSMSAIACRVATVPGHNVIGIELPNADRETVYLRELLSSAEFETNSGNLPIALGKDIGGVPVLSDLAKMPHLLIAGTTGSGKSVGVNAMILSILYRMTPDQCRFIMVDPKMLELSVYDGIPHLLAPVVTESKKAIVALKWAVQEMENRYRKMSKVGVRNIEGYNERMREAAAKGETFRRQVQTGFDAETGAAIFEEDEMPPETLPFIVIVIDEMADLMLVAGKEIEGTIQRLAQMARAAGVHLITATQRPSVDVITGTIKANFPSRISFQVTSKIDSRTVLGEQGGEQLLGMGDMLFMAGGGRLRRVHGPFVSDNEVAKVVSFLKKQGQPDYVEAVTAEPEESAEKKEGGAASDTLYDQAVAIVTRDNRASTSYVQRRLSIGYNRAATLIEKMEEQGVISAPNHAGKRDVLAGKH